MVEVYIMERLTNIIAHANKIVSDEGRAWPERAASVFVNEAETAAVLATRKDGRVQMDSIGDPAAAEALCKKIVSHGRLGLFDHAAYMVRTVI
jgi:hypothetical protein